MINKLFITLVLITLSASIQASQNNQSLLGSSLVINEFHADPATGIAGDANGNGIRETVEDEFVEIYNNSANDIDISGWTLSDATSVRHTFPSGSVVEGNCSIVVFGGNPVGAFGFSNVQSSSTGNVGLNNGGDTITLKSGPTVVTSYEYGSEGGNNQSLTRDPVATGLFVEHSIATGSNGSLFSPGVNPDGSLFSGCTIGDLPPRVLTTSPSNLASGVAVDANITFNFSEEVSIMPDAFEIDCEGSTMAWTVFADTPTSVTIDPSLDLPSGFCTVTALASLIADIDEDIDQLDGNGDTVGGDNYVFSFIVGVPELEIWQIQGDSTSSIYDGFTVKSNGNIITALTTNGFFMQTPDARDDNNVNTSNGIFVYLGSDPLGFLSVGEEIDIEGPVIEFFGTTEFSIPQSYTVYASGNPLPTPVLLNDNFPPNDPTIAPCSTDLVTHKYECFEGMYFDMPQGFISAGSSGNSVFPGANGDDVLVRAGSSRAFREPGIDFPGLPGLPVFDGNPEILEMDIDSLTLPLTRYSGGSEVSIKGVFGFEFDEYEIWPSEIIVINENVIPGSVRDKSEAEATIASANLYRFFDDVDDPTTNTDDDTILTPQEYQLKLHKLSKYFREDLKSPLIIGLQEIENLKVLDDLSDKIVADDGPLYSTSLINGQDPGGIDVGFMYIEEMVTVNSITQLGTSETQSTNGLQLHDRPPLHLNANINMNGSTLRVHVLVVHLRSRGGIDDNDNRVKIKRFEQANSVAAMINQIQLDFPGEAVITLGDFNAFDFTDGYADVIGQITGTALESDNLFWEKPLFADSPLTQAVHTLMIDDQYSYVFQGSAQLLDNAILNDAALLITNQIQFARGQSDANVFYEDNATNSLRVSDHDGFVLFLSNDAIFTNGFE